MGPGLGAGSRVRTAREGRLDPQTLGRLKSRHFTDEPFDTWLAAQVREWAERAAELR